MFEPTQVSIHCHKCLWTVIKICTHAFWEWKRFYNSESFTCISKFMRLLQKWSEKGKSNSFFSWFKYLIMANNFFFNQFNYFWDLKNEADMSGSFGLENYNSKLSLQRTEKRSKFIINGLYLHYVLQHPDKLGKFLEVFS